MEGQITSEQILLEAFANKDRPLERPKQTIQDLDELRLYQLTKRREYEQQLNKNRLNFGQWLRYAKWEANHNHDFARARSVFERALDVNVQHIPFWVQYIQFELGNKNINHARNLFDRATTTLPRVNKLWFLYVQTEETLKNYAMVRTIFENWLSWHPDSSAWDAYINFERRYGEYGNVRALFARFVAVDPSGETWMKWIEIELRGKDVVRTRYTFELAVDTILSTKALKNDAELPRIVAKWADWEVSVQEYERARAIYNLLLDGNGKVTLADEQKTGIHAAFTEFEKNHGNKDTIESSIVKKRRAQYQAELQQDPTDFDTWWTYIGLVLGGDVGEARKVFEQAVSHRPSESYKSLKWRRYIFLWIRYALWEEYENGNVDHARNVWTSCLNSVPHKQFTFGKAWVQLVEFELRHGADLATVRKILGRAIGQTGHQGPKGKIFRYYIALETRLGEWDRVRKLYEKWLELSLVGDHDVKSVAILLDYIEFEKTLEESERCVALYRLGLGLIENKDISPKLVPVEKIWISFINYYKDEMLYDEARQLYRALLDKVDRAKVWISFGLFESAIPTPTQLAVFNASDDDDFEFSLNDEHRAATRKVFAEANDHYKHTDNDNNDRLVVLEAWKSYEQAHGTAESVAVVDAKMPTIVKKRKTVDGIEHEYLDYLYGDDEAPAPAPALSAFLANAKKWALENDNQIDV